MEKTGKIPPEISQKMRTLVHDLGNSLETILQASYLLTQMELETTAKNWSEMIEQASRDAIRINREIREILRSST